MKIKKNLIKSLILFALSSQIAHAELNIDQWFTPQGTKVLFVENHNLPMLDLKISFKAGSAFDAPNKTGVASMTNSLFMKGADKLDETQIAQAFADIGTSVSNNIDDDSSSFSLRTLSNEKELTKSISMLQKILGNPTFSADILEREKNRLLHSIKELETQPNHIASKTFAELTYGKHPYSRLTYGDKKDIANIKKDDIQYFYKNFYNPKNAVIAIIGDISKDQAEKLTIELTNQLPKNDSKSNILKSLPAVDIPKSPQIKVVEHNSKQSHIHIGLPTLKRDDPDLYALVVGNYILGGGGFASRLMNEVREKRGYTYGISSYFYPNLEAGLFEISTQTKRENTKLALDLINNLVDDYLKNGPTEEEIAKAKASIIGGFALRLDSNKKILSYLSMIGFYNLPLTYLDDYPKFVAKITKEDIQKAFQRKLLPNNSTKSPLVTVIVGEKIN